MNVTNLRCIPALFAFLVTFMSLSSFARQKPNIIYILADDLGYGDVSSLNSNSKIQTTHIDEMAADGMRFTDAHSNSAVCTPTRYGILTGRYAWRTRLQSSVLFGYDSMLVSPGRTTLASFLKQNSYYTGCIGKWHLGLDWSRSATGSVDFTKPLSAGPIQAGFDYFYGIAASLDMPPYCYIENDRITAKRIDSVAGNSGKGFWRAGPAGEDFKHEEVLTRMTDKAVSFINERAMTGKPFFLYLPFPAPHTPILPDAKYRGKSGTNAYGDFVLMMDDMVGRILDAVKSAGVEENTMIVLTSDNGSSPMADFKELSAVGHLSNYIFRGAKADIYEGGHRIPFIIKWPAQVKRHTKSDQTICLTDFLATVSDILQQPLKYNEGEDSYSMLPLLLQEKGYKRTSTIHHSIDGNFAIRKGKWKLVLARGSGGWSEPTEVKAKELGLSGIQLFDVIADETESKNVATMYPATVRKLTRLVKKIVKRGRSTKGKVLKNDVKVEYRK